MGSAAGTGGPARPCRRSRRSRSSARRRRRGALRDEGSRRELARHGDRRIRVSRLARARRLYLAAPDGAFLAATSAAGPWQARTALGAPVAALHAAGPELLFAALHDGTIKRSDDDRRTWTVRTPP